MQVQIGSSWGRLEKVNGEEVRKEGPGGGELLAGPGTWHSPARRRCVLLQLSHIHGGIGCRTLAARQPLAYRIHIVTHQAAAVSPFTMPS